MIPFSGILGRGRPDNTADADHALFTTAGTTNWTVPAGVYWISGLCVGSGGNGFGRDSSSGINVSGGGGALVWANMIPVTPGEVLTITVGTPPSENGGPGRATTIARSDGSILVSARGGHGGNNQGIRTDGVGTSSFTADATGRINLGGSGNGGLSQQAGGGGAAGYSGTGGTGGTSNDQGSAATAGSGGGAGGGNIDYTGGGVGLFGEGTSGAVNAGGSGGDASAFGGPTTTGASNTVRYGSGGVGGSSGTLRYVRGSQGAARILWGKGSRNGGRAFPASNVSSAAA